MKINKYLEEAEYLCRKQRENKLKEKPKAK
jgi:hypothetical protein